MANYTPTTPTNIPEVRTELDKIAVAIRTVLHRDGTTPNQMEADFDMNGFQILNARVGDMNLTELAEAASAAVTAATEAAASRDAAAQSATDADEDADRAEAAAAMVSGVVTLPVLAWAQGTVVTNPTQRYLFDGVLFIAPSASADNPVTQGATPVGDTNWVDWSTPVYYYAHEETTTAAKTVFTLPLGFFEISDVYWESTFQPPRSYVVDTGNSTVTFSEPVPANTYVKIWAGRQKNDVIADYEQTIMQGRIIVYDAGDVTTPTDTFRPNTAFTVATVFLNGVTQRAGATNAYVIETDSNNAEFNQIRFTETLPAGVQVYAELRRQ